MTSSSSRNILFVAYHFPPAGGPAVQRSAKFARYLPDFGYRPIVLTAAQEHIESPLDRSLLEELGNITIAPCRGYERIVVQWPRKLRLTPLTSFWLRPDKGVLAWLPSAKRAARRIAAQYPISAVYTSAGPFSSVLLGAQLKKLLGVPWVADYRDLWTDDLMGVWPTKLHYWFESRQERRALEVADAIVVVTPTMKELLVRRYPQWASKIHLICNGFDQRDIPPGVGTSNTCQLRIGFTGSAIDYDAKPEVVGLGPLANLWASLLSFQHTGVDLSTYSPFYLFQAVRRLLDEHPELQGMITLCFAGHFGKRNLELIRQLRLQDVVCVKGYLPHAESVRLLMESDVLFLPLMSHADGRRSYAYTGKVFEYLATGRPILAAVPHGDARDLIDQARAGWCVDPHNVGAIKSLLEELIARKMAGTLGINPDQQLIRQFERRELTRQLAALLDSLLSS